jgi:hypothetical protein
MEEAKGDAAFLEHFVQRREDDVAHAGSHLPKQCASIREEHPQRTANCLARRESGPLRVSARVGHREVEQAAYESRVDRRFRCAVEFQPLSTFVVVDRIQAVRMSDDSVPHDAGENCDDEIDDRPDVASFRRPCPKAVPRSRAPRA